jgi:hypothetical protein
LEKAVKMGDKEVKKGEFEPRGATIKGVGWGKEERKYHGPGTH